MRRKFLAFAAVLVILLGLAFELYPRGSQIIDLSTGSGLSKMLRFNLWILAVQATVTSMPDPAPALLVHHTLALVYYLCLYAHQIVPKTAVLSSVAEVSHVESLCDF